PEIIARNHDSPAPPRALCHRLLTLRAEERPQLTATIAVMEPVFFTNAAAPPERDSLAHARINGFRVELESPSPRSDPTPISMLDFLAALELETQTRRQTRSHPEMRTDVLVIGAGPTGLACAIEAQKVGLKVVVLDKGCLVRSLFHYPPNMTFFTTPELLEIGDIPFTTAQQKPTREEALEYYRKVAEHYDVDVRQYEWVKTVVGEDGKFIVSSSDRAGRPHDYRARKVIVSTGYYD